MYVVGVNCCRKSSPTVGDSIFCDELAYPGLGLRLHLEDVHLHAELGDLVQRGRQSHAGVGGDLRFTADALSERIDHETQRQSDGDQAGGHQRVHEEDSDRQGGHVAQRDDAPGGRTHQLGAAADERRQELLKASCSLVVL